MFVFTEDLPIGGESEDSIYSRIVGEQTYVGDFVWSRYELTVLEVLGYA